LKSRKTGEEGRPAKGGRGKGGSGQIAVLCKEKRALDSEGPELQQVARRGRGR